MTFDLFFALVTSFGLATYLLYVLVRPERF